jgi:two-component sensor histidine kinase
MLWPGEGALATTGSEAPDFPGEAGDRLVLERGRLGLRLILAGVAVVFVGWIATHPGEKPLLSAVQAANFVAVAVALRLMGDPARQRRSQLVGFAAYAITIVATGAVGILAGDATTPLLIMVGMAVVSATLLGWSPWWQVASVLLIIATAIWTVASVVTAPRLFWLQNVGAVAPTLVATVFMAHVLRRQRAAVEQAERDRRGREEGLREANRRLEREILEHRRTEDRLRFAMRELDHRVKNTLATVQAVADQTLHTSADMREFADAFAGRLQAMARIHGALAERRWEGLTLTDLVELVVGPYRHHAESVLIACDGTFLRSELVRVLGMALHELATNAAKYGALSTAGGQVSITSHSDGGTAARLHIAWDEQGGPAVSAPSRRGFGMRLIEEALAYEADGRVVVRFPGEGLRCEIEVPVLPAA